MVISDENSFPVLIDSVETPISTEYFWVLDLAEQDFRLAPFVMNEEIITPTLDLMICGYVLEVPTNWNILLYSDDTTQLDIAEISELTHGSFSALAFLHRQDRAVAANIRVVNYNISSKVYSPTLQKNQMLCHTIGPDMWVCISPSDNYNKYLKNKTIGDLLY